jgi:hypothetical protein
MDGNSQHVNSPEMRKRMLVAASDRNRARLAREWVELIAEVRTLTGRAKSLGSLASGAGLLVAGLAAWRSRKASDTKASPSRWSTILKIAGTVSNLWLARRSNARDREHKTIASRS